MYEQNDTQIYAPYGDSRGIELENLLKIEDAKTSQFENSMFDHDLDMRLL